MNASSASRSGGLQTAGLKPTAVWRPPLLDEELQKLDCSVPALRRFAFTICALLVSLGAFMLWRHRTAGWPLLSLALLLLAAAILAPSLLRFVYRPWMILALLLGSVASRIMLTFAFFLVVTPIGLLQRLCGKSALEFSLRPDQTSYWQPRTAHRVPADDEKQF